MIMALPATTTASAATAELSLKTHIFRMSCVWLWLIFRVTLQQKILLDQGDEAGKLDGEVSALVSVNIGKD